MIFFLKDFPQRTKLEVINFTLTILSYVNPSFPQFQIIFFFSLKTQKKNILQQETGGNTPILAFREMLEHFLKITALQKY